MDVHPLLERLYIQEHRKLNAVMKYMEEKEGFCATYGFPLTSHCALRCPGAIRRRTVLPLAQ